jgi:hypothetical protein
MLISMLVLKISVTLSLMGMGRGPQMILLLMEKSRLLRSHQRPQFGPWLLTVSTTPPCQHVEMCKWVMASNLFLSLHKCLILAFTMHAMKSMPPTPFKTPNFLQCPHNYMIPTQPLNHSEHSSPISNLKCTRLIVHAIGPSQNWR